MTSATTTPHVLLLPGAWMGSWIWAPTAERLRDRGVDAAAITLVGLEPGTSPDRVARVRLGDHVAQVLDHLSRRGDRPTVLVAHSYSGMVAAQVADRLGDQVVRSLHFDSFLPVDGRSLIDDWGSDDVARGRERADIVGANYQWAPPPSAALEKERGLSATHRALLSDRFTAHPGRTVLDSASMGQPFTSQRAVFVASTEASVPTALRSEHARRCWSVEILRSGHWPMLERPDDVAMLIAAPLVG